MQTQKLFQRFLFCLLGIIIFPSLLFANSFNQLVQEKRILENQFGIEALECFPFIKNIGFTDDQIPLIEQCLKGTTTLKEALNKVSHRDYKEVGISNRFLRTAGFHTVLIDWKASPNEIAEFLNTRLSNGQRTQFLDKIHALKKEISSQIQVKDLYCSKEISNSDCLKGYENLAAVGAATATKKLAWHEIMITDSPSNPDAPRKLILGFNNSPEEMRNRLKKDPYQSWRPQKKLYDAIQEKYGKAFKKKLQLENFVCASDITLQECEQGATHLFEASKSIDFRMRYWGQVVINRYNTLIQDDFHAQIRFDLPAEQIVQYFSRKALKTQAEKDTTLAVKLEGRTKNNPSKLRAVCDLSGLRAALCANAFKTFIRFVKSNRDYQVLKPWDTLMFIDGTQLARVNFALNSSARSTYLYIDANSNDEQFSNYLGKFRSGN
ncbi:MAG: hypothetical protein ACI8PD_000170 [Nitrospinales bacterium]|jgi:hypothetical protein